MRITVSHTRPKQEVIQSVDRSFDELFRGMGGVPIQLVPGQKKWSGSTLNFSLTAKMGFLSTPIKGIIEVTDKDLTIDADLGLLEKLIPQVKAREAIATKVRGLLT